MYKWLLCFALIIVTFKNGEVRQFPYTYAEIIDGMVVMYNDHSQNRTIVNLQDVAQYSVQS